MTRSNSPRMILNYNVPMRHLPSATKVLTFYFSVVCSRSCSVCLHLSEDASKELTEKRVPCTSSCFVFSQAVWILLCHIHWDLIITLNRRGLVLAGDNVTKCTEHFRKACSEPSNLLC